MKKLLLAVLVLIGLQTQAQINICDSVTISGSQYQPTIEINNINTKCNILGANLNSAVAINLLKKKIKFIVDEKPYFEHIEEFERAVDNYLTEPTDADSTPLGEVPQEPVKGSIRPGWIRGPYGMNIMYRN